MGELALGLVLGLAAAIGLGALVTRFFAPKAPAPAPPPKPPGYDEAKTERREGAEKVVAEARGNYDRAVEKPRSVLVSDARKLADEMRDELARRRGR